METINKKVLLGVGTVVAAVGASLCCIVPVAVVLLGVGSAALGAQLEPVRPFFLGLTLCTERNNVEENRNFRNLYATRFRPSCSLVFPVVRAVLW